MPGNLTKETKPTEKDGLAKQVVPHKRVLNNKTKPEVEPLLLLSNIVDLKLGTEEPLQIQGTQLETTSSEVELLPNKSKPKIQTLLP
jgi:hypothetical protein